MTCPRVPRRLYCRVMSARTAIPGVVLALLLAGTVEAQPMYRYINDEGNAVVAY